MNTRPKIPLITVAIFICTFCLSDAFAQKVHLGVNQSLSSFRQREFSPEGNYLLTLDDKKTAIYNIRKRQYVNFIDVPEKSYIIPRDEQSFYLAHHMEAGYSTPVDYLYITQYNFRDTQPQRTDSISLAPFAEIAKEIYYNSTFRIASPQIWHHNIETKQLCFIVMITEKETVAERQYLATVDLDSYTLTLKNLGVHHHVNSISTDGRHIFVATPSDILKYTPQTDSLSYILPIQDKKDAYATIKTMNNKLHILSNRYTLYDYIEDKVIETKSITPYFYEMPDGSYSISSNENFIVTKDDQVYLIDNSKQERSDYNTYNIIQINDHLRRPFNRIGGLSSFPGKHISYNGSLNLLAFNHDILDIDHGYLFSMIDTLQQRIEVIEFTDKPGNMLIGRYNELFEVDLATQQIRYTPTINFPTYLSNLLFGKEKNTDYDFKDTTLYYYNSDLGNYEYPVVKYRDKFHRVYNMHDQPTHLVNDSLFYWFASYQNSIPLNNGNIELSENQYTLYVSKNNQIKKIDLRVNLTNYYENDTSPFMVFDHSRFIADKKLLVIFFNAANYGNPIQHWIDLEKGKIINTTKYKLLTFKSDNSVYLTEDGFFSSSHEKVDIPFDNFLLSGLLHETNKSYTHIRNNTYAFASIYRDSVYIVDFSDKTRLSIPIKEGVRKIIKDPHSPNLFILNKMDQLIIWNTETLTNPIHINILCKSRFDMSKSETVIEHPETLLLSSDNLYAATGSYKSALYWNADFNPDFNYIDTHYNRPDIVLQDLGYSDPDFLTHIEQIIDKRIARNKQTTPITHDIRFDYAKTSKLLITPEQKFVLNASFDEPLQNVKGYTIYVNGVKLKSVENLQSNVVIDSIELYNEINKISIVLIDENGNETTGDHQYIKGYQKSKTDIYTVAIGISKYQDSTYNLTYARKDAEDISSTSKLLYTYDNQYNLQIHDSEATLENILSKTKEFLRDIKPTDQVFIYFAGHGLLDEEKNLYLAPHDMKFDKPIDKGLLIDNYLKVLEDVPSLYKLLIMDACHTGLDDDYITPVYYEYNEEEDLKIIKRGSIAQSMDKNKPQLIDFAFETLNQGNGIDIIAASSASEYAIESASANNGIFTYNFINSLLNINNDLDQNNYLDVYEIIKDASLNTLKMTQGQQRPMLRQANQDFKNYLIEIKDTREGKIFEAAKGFDDINYLQAAIKDGFDLNKKQSGLTLLMYAARQNNLQAINILLRNNVDIEEAWHFDRQPAIYFAAYNDHTAATETLLNAYKQRQIRIKLSRNGLDNIQKKSKKCYEMIRADVDIVD
ncbi:caspase family protein [Sphingobacterium corticibacterium]|uniref:Peptidase C14 caspase domain-containing protein n=1 Tax=Sphingobacterium corticibacterium TaxID=2484746 RepID=A0A4Q6XZL3_9SPHI|nr:caspase family protein [Sphingobacterium corticibacterium]RZF62076.1 hypothetical protein EWE74_04470 [Sphingobacterium corticibacterium]